MSQVAQDTASVASRRVSLWSITWQVCVALSAAVAIGGALSFSVIMGAVDDSLHAGAMSPEVTCVVEESPPTDAALTAWLQRDPTVRSATVTRRGNVLSILCQLRSAGIVGRLPDAMRRMGYRVSGYTVQVGTDLGRSLFAPKVLLPLLAFTQVGFLAVVGICIRRERLRGRSNLLLFRGGVMTALIWGVGGGCLLLIVGFLSDVVQHRLLGHIPPSPWHSVAGMPAKWVAALFVFGAVGAPVAEEFFFRGCVYGLYRREGYPAAGLFISAALFAALHFSDLYNVPAIFVFGLVFAGLYARTCNLLTPVTAHLINNSIMLAMLVRGG